MKSGTLNDISQRMIVESGNTTFINATVLGATNAYADS